MTIKPAHPRCWLTPERLQWLKTTQTTRLEWKRLLSACEDGWNRDTYNNALNYALVYQVTGSRKYAEKAKQLAELYIAMGPEAMTKVGTVSPHGFGARIVLPEVGVTYDWLSGFLNEETRKRWADQLMAWSDWCWLETNPTKGVPPMKTPDTWGQNNPGDNFYLGFLMSLIATFAVWGEHPRAQPQLLLGLEKLGLLEDYLSKYATGGFSLEGTQYGSWIRHGWLWAALKTATDYSSPVWESFLKDAVACRPHVTTPDLKGLVPLGGQPGVQPGWAPLTEDHAGTALTGMAHGAPVTQALAKGWYDSITFSRKRQNSWQPALWYDNRLKAPAMVQQPTVYTAPGSGFVSMRSTWGAGAAVVVFQCGPVKESHQDYGAGAFYLWSKGEWLTGPARLWGTGGELLWSEFCNVLLVGKDAKGAPRGQPGQVGSQALPKDSMRLAEAPKTDGATTRLVGEAGRAYDYYQSMKVFPVLEWWTRELVWESPHTLSVVDKVRKVKPADAVIFQLQCRFQPEVNGSRYTVRGQNGMLTGEARQDGGAVIIDSRETYRGLKGALSSFVLQVTVPGGPAEFTLVNRLEVMG